MASTSPYSQKTHARVAPVVLGSDLVSTAVIAPSNGTIVGVDYLADATITGAVTNNRTISVINKGQAGAGTAVPASLNFGSGVNASANVAKGLTLSATASDLEVLAGDVLVFSSVHIGTGIADPGGLVRIKIAPEYNV